MIYFLGSLFFLSELNRRNVCKCDLAKIVY